MYVSLQYHTAMLTKTKNPSKLTESITRQQHNLYYIVTLKGSIHSYYGYRHEISYFNIYGGISLLVYPLNPSSSTLSPSIVRNSSRESGCSILPKSSSSQAWPYC